MKRQETTLTRRCPRFECHPRRFECLPVSLRLPPAPLRASSMPLRRSPDSLQMSRAPLRATSVLLGVSRVSLGASCVSLRVSRFSLRTSRVSLQVWRSKLGVPWLSSSLCREKPRSRWGWLGGCRPGHAVVVTEAAGGLGGAGSADAAVLVLRPKRFARSPEASRRAAFANGVFVTV